MQVASPSHPLGFQKQQGIRGQSGKNSAPAGEVAATGNDAAAKVDLSRAAKNAGKAAPPGLERVLTKFQSIPEAERSAGQTIAMDRIARNLARYMEIQAIGSVPAPVEEPAVPASTEKAVAEATVETAAESVTNETTPD